MATLISACLLGCACRYDGASKPLPAEVLKRLAEFDALAPVCPEQLGGLATPRDPAERAGERVLTAKGADVTAQYRRGAIEALRIAKTLGCTRAVLKSRSPSCGRGVIYDGTHTHTLTAGDGVTAELLQENGIRVWTEEEIGEMIGE